MLISGISKLELDVNTRLFLLSAVTKVMVSPVFKLILEIKVLIAACWAIVFRTSTSISGILIETWSLLNEESSISWSTIIKDLIW